MLSFFYFILLFQPISISQEQKLETGTSALKRQGLWTTQPDAGSGKEDSGCCPRVEQRRKWATSGWPHTVPWSCEPLLTFYLPLDLKGIDSLLDIYLYFFPGLKQIEVTEFASRSIVVYPHSTSSMSMAASKQLSHVSTMPTGSEVTGRHLATMQSAASTIVLCHHTTKLCWSIR